MVLLMLRYVNWSPAESQRKDGSQTNTVYNKSYLKHEYQYYSTTADLKLKSVLNTVSVTKFTYMYAFLKGKYSTGKSV